MHNNFFYKLLKKLWYKIILFIHGEKGVPYQVNDFKFRMPRSSYKYVEARFFPKDYERENFKFFEQMATKDMVCIDIGAHIGLYAVFMSKRGNAQVYSFEPTPTSQEVFRDMIAVNKCNDRVTLVPGAVSAASGKATFFMTDTPLWVGNSLLTRNFADDKVKGYEVNVYSVDDFVATNSIKLDFIKIDAEGVELEVLKGAKKTFQEFSPSGILGIHPSTFENKKETYEKLWDTLIEYGMEIMFDNQSLNKERFMTEMMDYKNPFDLQFVGKGAGKK
jgi:FkbM family methyltransferase